MCVCARVYVCVCVRSRKLDVLHKAAKEISEASGNVVVPIQLDVRDPDAVGRALDTIVEQLGLPHVVVNNAAGNFVAPTERLSPNACKTIVDIVLSGTMHVTLDLGKRLIKAKQGTSAYGIEVIVMSMRTIRSHGLCIYVL